LAFRLRPLILNTHRIDVLSDLVKSLDALFDTRDSSVRTGIEPILHDAQSRLAFRAQNVISQQVTNFTPKEAELLIFARVKNMPLPQVTSGQGVGDVLKEIEDKELLSINLEKRLSISEAIFSGQHQNGFGGGEYYPPCKSTVQILASIYHAVPVLQYLY
jgi:hypothetical protein